MISATISRSRRAAAAARAARSLLLLPLLLGMTAVPALAHVQLDAPNGGERLEVGSVFTIEWHDVIDHGSANYDLWYSTTGPDGPWIEIAVDLARSFAPDGETYDWMVLGAPSDEVRVRVRQDNDAGPKYNDVSDGDLAIFEPADEAPAANFEYAPASPYVGDQIVFTDLSSGVPTAWLWDFGDGASSGLQNPSHVYASEGTYTVNLTASNDAGDDSRGSDLSVLPAMADLGEMVLLPAAANAAGANGSFFVTAVDIYNAGQMPASYRILWLPRDTDNSTPASSAVFSLAAGETRRFQDLLGEAFGASGAVGAVAIMSDSAELDVMSRTFNRSDAGTFGQSVPGLSAGELTAAGRRVRVLFLTENDAYRSNLGLASGVGFPITIGVELFAADGDSLGTQVVELPPLGNAQLNRVLRVFAPIEAAHAEVWTTTAGAAFTCYGAVLDEVSSDPTTVLPK